MSATTEPSWLSEFREGGKAFIGGTISGFACKLIEFPFDTVKVKLQTDVAKLYGGSAARCFSTTIRKEGVLGLYKGLSPPLVASMVENAITFTTYNRAQNWLQAAFAPSSNSRISPPRSSPTTSPQPILLVPTMISGMAAGFNISLLLTPVELIKCRLQVQREQADLRIARGAPPESVKNLGPIAMIRNAYRNEGGLRAFYRGHTGTMLREIPGGAAYFGIYESIVKAFIPRGGTKDDVPALYLAICGSVGGIAYWTVFFPADTVKSRMQALDVDTSATSSRSTFSSTLRSTFKTDGVRGLYAGFGITLIRAVPANFTIFFCYEMTMRLLK